MTQKAKGSLLALSALGVVYGDIGTSPLYALRESMSMLPNTTENILGVLSLVFWTLSIIVFFKYIFIVFRADNEGEGGILALLSLLKRHASTSMPMIYLIGMIGAGLLIGDGMLTPAISVSGAIEGLSIVSTKASDYLPVYASLVLFILFLFQRYGSLIIGLVFGPVILLWFIVIALLGVKQIMMYPQVLQSIHPKYAFEYLLRNGFHGYLSLGGVFLVVTGAEALFADIGHFGKQPIRLTWALIVFPCLILNYMGQGALVILQPEALENPFYHLVTKEWIIPLVGLATCATIIASQAMITATFSLIKQAILLGVFPRMRMIQTSKYLAGQIYIPQMNLFLMFGSILLVLWFHDASGLAHAYGIGVNLEMLLVSFLVAYAAHQVWQWSPVKILLIFGLLFIVDVVFLGANLHKFISGGWIPVGIALFVAFTMMTWKIGFRHLQGIVYRDHPYIEHISTQLAQSEQKNLKGMAAIFVTDHYNHSGKYFLHFLRTSLAFAEHILIVSYRVELRPYVHFSKRYEIHAVDKNIYGITLHYGFMEHVSIPHAIKLINNDHVLPFDLSLDEVTYWVEGVNVVASKLKTTLWFYTQERYFAFLLRNYSPNLNIEFYHLPYDKTISIGTYTII